MYEEFNLSVLKTPFSQVSNESDIEEYDDDDVNVDEKDNNDDEDFLTTTFTWNLRRKPKLQTNDTDNDDDADKDNLHKEDNARVDAEDVYKFNAVPQNPFNKSKEILCQNLKVKDGAPEKDQKMDKLERCWPWADREKIIYKQSTCHLVPHKPLGLIEQRIQLLAKRNLLEHINKIKSPQ